MSCQRRGRIRTVQVIPAQDVVDRILQAAARGRAGEVHRDRHRPRRGVAALGRQLLTTNGVATSRSMAVISVVRKGMARTSAPAFQRRRPRRHRRTGGRLPAGRPWCAGSARRAPLLTGASAPLDWEIRYPAPGGRVRRTGAVVVPGFGRSDRLCGFAHHIVETTFGHLHRAAPPVHPADRVGGDQCQRDGASAWARVEHALVRRRPGRRDAAGPVHPAGLVQAQHRVAAGRYETLMPPSTVADMMIYLGWSMDGPGRSGGRTHCQLPAAGRGSGKLTDLGLTMYSDRSCPAWVLAVRAHRVWVGRMSVFDNGMDITRVDWIRDGTISGLAYPRAAAAEFGAEVAVPADNLLMTGGTSDLAGMVAATERGLLLTTLWYIRTVDPTTLLLTGLTRDGVPHRGR